MAPLPAKFKYEINSIGFEVIGCLGINVAPNMQYKGANAHSSKKPQ
jgi:hypothetical protein